MSDLGLLKPIVAPEYTYVIADTFRTRNRRPRKGRIDGRISIQPGVAWVFEDAVIWTEGQDDDSVLSGAKEVLSFTRGKTGFGNYIGPVLMMVPVDPYQIIYTFTAGDPRVERRRDIQDFNRKHHHKKLYNPKVPLEKFRGSSPPKPMPKAQREKISRSLINRRYQRDGAKQTEGGGAMHNAYVLKCREEEIAREHATDPEGYYAYLVKRYAARPIISKQLESLWERMRRPYVQTDIRLYLKGEMPR